MGKTRKTKKKHEKFTKKATNLRRSRWIVFSLGALLVVGLSLYLQNREDLGEQLPPPPTDALYKQADQAVELRVADLLARMTLEEKIGQMSLVDKNSLIRTEDVSRYNLGAVLSGAGAKPDSNTPEGWLDLTQKITAEAAKSRLGIPILFGTDANHGHGNVPSATIFPHAIGLGATNDPELVKKIAVATSDELRATGINWNYSPSLDGPKDIRWGRVYEAFSDDPALIAALGSAYITGAQLPQEGTSVLTSAKHYIGTGSMGWDTSNHKTYKIDQGVIIADEKILREQYLPPFQAAVTANVSSIMVALTDWGDERIIDSNYLITDVLKNDMKFNGFVVSDWYGVYEYADSSDYDANVSAINAGLDMAMLPFKYKSFLKDVKRAVEKQDISIERIDDAVSRILTKKFESGLFDTSIVPVNDQLAKVGSKEHRLLARIAAAQSMTLLKNDKKLLPLNKDAKRILVAGSGADNVGRQVGAWTVEWQGIDGNDLPGATSILQGIKETVSSGTQLEYAQNGVFSERASIGIAIISEKPYAEGFGDNEEPKISDEDLQAIENLKKSADQVVVVLISGRPLLISDEINGWDAFVAAWLPGSEGAGVADVLFGDQQFTGRLPLPWPASLSQLPITANGDTQDSSIPLFERGFGL